LKCIGGERTSAKLEEFKGRHLGHARNRLPVQRSTNNAESANTLLGKRLNRLTLGFRFCFELEQDPVVRRNRNLSDGMTNHAVMHGKAPPGSWLTNRYQTTGLVCWEMQGELCAIGVERQRQNEQSCSHWFRMHRFAF
jgi:hypothetical protein